MNKIIIANWKMNPPSLKQAFALAKNIDFKNCIILPPALYLLPLKQILKKAKLGVQNFYYEKSGAFTGELSFYQFKKIGINYFLIGHSERRLIFLENDALINRKIKAVLQAKGKPILCIGEVLTTRKKGKKFLLNFLKKQILSALKGLKVIDNLILVYEPVWAIGTNKFAQIKEVDYVFDYLKKVIFSYFKIKKNNFFTLYGGSVDIKNFKNYLDHNLIDGLLVGRASLKSDFKKFFYE